MGEIAIMKKVITKVLSCFVVLVILMSVLPFFVTQTNAVMPVDIYMGKVTGKNNDVLTVQIEYTPDSNPHNWVSYSATSQWTISNSNAINEIRVGDYIEIAGLLGVDNEGESICIGKMKSRTEKIITDVYGDPDYLVPVHAFIEHPGVLNPPLMGDYIITYENIPDCSKCPSGSFGCNVEAKYSDVTISNGNEQLKSQRLYPGRSFKYEDKGGGYNIDITFNSGEAPAYPDCTDQPCFGPQAFSDFTIHIKKIEEKMPDLIIQDISWNPSNPKEGDTVTFTVTVKNQGSGSAGYSYVYYYIGGSYVDSDYVPSLSAGSTSTQSFTWTVEVHVHVPMSARKTVSAAERKVPMVFPIVEAWIVRACADATDLVDESNEDNNCREETVEINEEKKPDLVIEDISWSPEKPKQDIVTINVKTNEKPKQGDTITFTVTVKNQGTGDAGAFYVYYYIDDSYLDCDSVPSLPADSTSIQPSALAADKRVSSMLSDPTFTQQTFTWTANKCGDVQVKAVADATNAIDESNEGNNERTETVSVTCQNHPPIAYIDSITPNPAILDTQNIEESETISFSGHGTDPDGDSIIAYNWRSEDGTQLSTSSSFNISSNMFGLESYTIYFKVKDSHNAWSNEVSNDFLIIYPILTEIEFKGKVLDAGKEPKLAGCLVRITEILEQKGEDIEINVGDEVIAVGLTESERYDTDIKTGDKIKVYGSLYNYPVTFQNLSADFFVDLISSSSFYLNKDVEEKKPDLIIQDISWSPSKPKQGDTITFTVKIMNQGTGNAKKSHLFFGVAKKDENKFCFSRSSIIPSIAAGKTYTYTVNYNVTECGIYRIIANEDHCQEIEESDEDNNYREELLEIPCEIEKSDLTVTDFTWSPEHLKIGDTIKITFCITNEGKGVATENKASFVIANTSTKEILVNKTINLMDLNPKFGYCGGVNCIVKKCGTFSVIVSATTAHDSNLQNNTLAKKLEIECIREKPDLVIQDITWKPENPKQGDNVEFAVTVKNIGKETAEKSHVFIYGKNWDAGKVLLDEVKECPSLKSGETYTYHKNVKIEDRGEYDISAWTDAQNEVNESNEKNNYKGASFTVPCPKEKPDLTISSISIYPKNPKVGDEVTFKATVKNQGNGNTKTTSFVIGTLYEPTQFGPSPSSLWSRAVFPFSAGEEYAFSATRKLTACGNYRFRAEADNTFNIDESNEENNYRDIDFTVPCLPKKKSDLTVQSITLSPSSPAQEGTITFTVKIENKGAGDAGGFYVYYYIDGSNVDSDHISSLSAGATSTQTFTWTANKCGSFQVKALADATNAVDESNEDNNEKTKTLSIRCPDLKVESVTYSPKKVLQGTMITVTAKIKNIGDADAEESNINIEFTDSTGQSKGREVVKIGALSVGEETTIEKNYLMQQTGKRIVSVEANYDKAVKESDYSNNKKKVTIEVIEILISVNVYNVNKWRLAWGGEINVKAYDEDDNCVENAEKSFNNVDSVTVSLQVPPNASLIRVFQTPKIKGGVQEYWGSLAIQPTRQTTYEFTRHTSWISGDITIDGHSIYSNTINLNEKGNYSIAIPVTNSGYSENSVIVEVLLDRDEKEPWDFRTDDLISINSKEEKDFHFTYKKDKETTGIWRFRAIVKEQYESEEGAIAYTDQRAWYIIINKGLLDREFYLGITAQSYYAFISQDSDKALDKTIEDTIKLYNSQVIGASEDEAKKSLLQVIKKYDPVLGSLFEAYTSINDLIHFAENVQKILNNIMIAADLQLIKRTDGYSNAEQYSSDLGSCDGIQERVKCWKSGDEEAIEDMLTEESQYLSFMRGFADSARGGMITIEVRQQLDDFSNSCSEQEDEVKHLYYELVNHDLDKYNDFKVKSNWYSKANP